MNRDIAKVTKQAKYVSVSEDDYQSAIKMAIETAHMKMLKTKSDLTRERLKGVIQKLNEELNLPVHTKVSGFFKGLLGSILIDTKDDEAKIDVSLYSINKNGIKMLLGFKNITFYSEYSDSTHGKVLLSVDELLKDTEESTIARVRNTIVIGFILGINPNAIVREIGKIPNIEKEDLNTLVRTMISDVQQRVNMENLERNKEFYDGYEFSAALDNQTTNICKETNEKRWDDFDDIPKDLYPPIHPNCRSTIIGKIED